MITCLRGYSGLYENLLEGHLKEDHDQDWKSLKNTFTSFGVQVVKLDFHFAW